MSVSLTRHLGVRRALAVVGGCAVLSMVGVLGWGYVLTTSPRPDNPPHVDAVLVLHSGPDVYDAAVELAARGVTNRMFVSVSGTGENHEQLCGTESQLDPALEGIQIECFSPAPVTTQGEVLYARQRMSELGLRDLGVLTFPQHLERARVLAERCWAPENGSVSMYQFDAERSPLREVEHTVYGTLAYLKVVATPGCGQELPRAVEAPLDWLKDVRVWLDKRVTGR